MESELRSPIFSFRQLDSTNEHTIKFHSAKALTKYLQLDENLDFSVGLVVLVDSTGFVFNSKEKCFDFLELYHE
jgi:hypothetical protein